MKIVVAHNSPDWDSVISMWLIRRFLPRWETANLAFVPAGERYKNAPIPKEDAIEKVGTDEVIHVDTGLGPLDHHQTDDQNISAASLVWDFVKTQSLEFRIQNDKSNRIKDKEEAISRMVKIVVDLDHFREVFWDNPTADFHEFSLFGVLEGVRLEKPNDDNYAAEFGMECLDAVLHNFENRIWAEKEIKEKGKKFKTKWGESIAFDTINDSVLKLAQKMGFVIVVRKDPRKGYVRIKARPSEIQNSKFKIQNGNSKFKSFNQDIDLTLVYEKLKKMDPDATWFLHVSKKMLLNGTVKNPKMIPTKLTLDEIVKVLEKI